MKKYLLFVAFATFVFFTSCDVGGERVDGNGNLKTEVRAMGELTKINVLGGLDVFVGEGSPQIKVEGDENILQYVETRVDNGWLDIRTKQHFNINSQNPIKVYVTTRSISDLKVTGSGNIACDKKFSSGSNMTFSVTGSGNITAEVNAPEIDAEITGSGNLYLKGETRNAAIKVTGSGNYESPELKAEKANVQISGSGNATLFAETALKANITGSGDIKYSGNADVEKHIAGSGSVIKN